MEKNDEVGREGHDFGERRYGSKSLYYLESAAFRSVLADVSLYGTKIILCGVRERSYVARCVAGGWLEADMPFVDH